MIVYDGSDIVNIPETSCDEVSRQSGSHLGNAIFDLITVSLSFMLGYILGKHTGKQQADLEQCENSKYQYNECAGC